MPAEAGVITDRLFYAFAHPLYRRRFHLALVFAIILFPIIAAGLIIGTFVLLVPLFAFLLWLSARVFFAWLLGNSILVSSVNYPRVNALAEELKTKLDYKKPIYIFVYEQGSFNAYMSYLFFRRAIFLNSELLESGVSDDEIRWLVGRFVGYLRARRQAGVLGWVIRAAQNLVVFNLFLLPFERAMVLTGDRIAVAAMGGDISSAISALQKLFVGRQLGYSVNPEGIIEQQRKVKGSFFAFLARLASAFPHMTTRYVDLIVFGKAFFPAQFAKFEATNPGLPADLAQLAASPQSGVAPALERLEADARPPHGWAWATGTAAAIVAAAVLFWQSYVPPSSVVLEREPDTPAAATPAASPPPAAQTVLPPNVRLDSSGRLTPDPGCQWLNDDPGDFRVVCR